MFDWIMDIIRDMLESPRVEKYTVVNLRNASETSYTSEWLLTSVSFFCIRRYVWDYHSHMIYIFMGHAVVSSIRWLLIKT